MNNLPHCFHLYTSLSSVKCPWNPEAKGTGYNTRNSHFVSTLQKLNTNKRFLLPLPPLSEHTVLLYFKNSQIRSN